MSNTKLQRYRWATFVLLLFAFSCRSGGTGGLLQTGWKPVETFQFDWNGDGKDDTFILENPSTVDEPGSFKRLRIRLNGQPEFTIENEDYWVRFGPGINRGDESFNHQNLSNSQYVLFLPASTNNKKRSLMFLMGLGVGSTPGRLQVVQINDDGSPQVIFYRDEFDLADFTDIDGDGYPELVGKPCFEQMREDGLQTYAPYQAYVIPREAGGKVTLSMGMSATYNRLHYYGWAGPESSEELVILQHPPAGGNPLIMKASDAAKFMQGEKKADGTDTPDKSDDDKANDKK